MSPGESGPERLATALALFGTGTISLPDAPPAVSRRLRPHLRILQAIVFLREVGGSDELEARLSRLLDAAVFTVSPRNATEEVWQARRAELGNAIAAASGVESPLAEWDGARFDAMAAHHHPARVLAAFFDGVDAMAKSLSTLREQARSYEAALAEGGLRFDADSGHVKEASGGRPRSVFPEIAEAVYNGLVEEGAREEITEEVRATVAPHLAGFFPPDWLDPRRDGYLDRALRNATRSNRGGTAR